MIEPLFELCTDDLDVLLPHMKIKLMSGTESAQVHVVEEILMFLKRADEASRGTIVRKFVKFNVISTICDVVQISEESFIRVILECFELMSNHKEFYEDYTAMCVTESMLRFSYCISRSLTCLRLLEELVQSICNILVRSLKFAVNFDTVCIPQQIVLFLKNLDIRDSSRKKLKFTAVAMLNVVLQRAILDKDDLDTKLIVNVCRDALKSMADIVKYGEIDDNDTILCAVVSLCGTCDGASRFCNVDKDDRMIDAKREICQMKADLSSCVYSAMMNVIVPYVKDANLSRVDSIEFHRSLVSCLNNLYQLGNCNHDDLSNHLAANGYLKYFLYLIVRLPENLCKSVCALLSRILNILGKTAFCKDTITFANILRQGLLQLPRDTKRWDDAVAHYEEAGTALLILLYYHFQGTRENDVISLRSLIARVMSLQKYAKSISVSILKPLWFLFAVTSLSHPGSYYIPNYTNAVTRLMSILQRFELGEFYTHHIDLLHHCLKCPNISQNFANQVLDLWLIESEGDIKPLLPFNRDKVVRRLLIVLQTGYSDSITNLAAKALRQVIQTCKDDKYQIDEIAEIVWHMLPNILLHYHSKTDSSTVSEFTHIEAILELANITKPQTMPMHIITRSTNIIIDIILKKNANLKFMTLIVTQAYIFLVTTATQKSYKALEMYIQEYRVLKKLYAYGFAKEMSQLCTISTKLLAFIVYYQKETSLKCKRPLIVYVKSLIELLMRAETSPCCSISGMQLVLELLTQNTDGSAVVLQKIGAGVDMLINLYEVLHILHMQKDPSQKDLVYQCLVALLNFCNAKVNSDSLLPHLCTVMSNYDLVFNIVNMRYVSCHFVEFVVTWLRHRKATCRDVPWNDRSLFKTPFDEVLDYLKEYSALVSEKGLTDAHVSLQDALSQFSNEQ